MYQQPHPLANNVILQPALTVAAQPVLVLPAPPLTSYTTRLAVKFVLTNIMAQELYAYHASINATTAPILLIALRVSQATP